MSNIKKINFFLVEHYLAIIIAGIVGLISVAPEALSIISLGQGYQGIPFLTINDNLIYASKIQEILDGHLMANSAAFYEYKNQSSLILPFGEYFYVLPAWLFNLNMADILIFNKFLLPAILFFLVYILVINLGVIKNLFSNKINAIAAGLFVTLGNDLVNLKGSWRLITGQIPDFISLGWTRPVNPIVGGILLFTFLLLVWQTINRGKWYLPVTAGILMALMLFYFFSWSLGLAVISLLAVIFLFKKERKIFGYFVVAIFTFFLAGIFYWLEIWRVLSSTSGSSLAAKNGMLLMHAPLFNKVLLASLFIFLPCLIYEYILKRREKKEIANWWWFCLALLLGGFLALNQQIITGRAIWPYHFVQYTIPFAIVAIITLLNNFIKPKYFPIWQALVIIIILSSFAYGLASSRGYFYQMAEFKNLQRYALSLNWLNHNAPKDCVILTIDKPVVSRLAFLTTAMTHCNVYASDWIALSPIPAERIIHNYLTALRLKGISREEIDDYLINHQDEVGGYFFKDIAMANAKAIDKDDPYVLEKIKYIAPAYKNFYEQDFFAELKKYRLDYIMVEGDLSIANKKLLPNLKFIGEFNGIYLYKF